MREKLGPQCQAHLRLLDQLCNSEIISWPIDFDNYHGDDDELFETFGCWFGSDGWSQEGDAFVQIGQDGTGSLFLLWYYPGLTSEPPVVFLGSEGDACLVATNIADFIRQLGSGKLFYDGDWLAPSDEESQQLDWQKLKAAVENSLGPIEQAPEQLSKLAANAHPDFGKWAESKVAYL